MESKTSMSEGREEIHDHSVGYRNGAGSLAEERSWLRKTALFLAHRRAARPAAAIHAHMLRHACGFALANAGHDTRAIQDWLGHRSIQHTVRYTELSPARFKDFWR
jgi:site-specific recombinase XerD